MFNNIKELKDFILWAKSEKIGSLKIKDIQIDFSNLAFLDDNLELQKSHEDLNDTVPQAEQDKQDEDDLYWST